MIFFDSPMRTLEYTPFKQPIKDHIGRWNPGFCAAADAVKKPLPPVYVGSYFFGDYSLGDGGLKIPNPDGEIVSIYDPSISNEVREQLSYTETMPLSILLDNGMELYMSGTNNIIQPWKIMRPGHILGGWGGLDLENAYYVYAKIARITAGSRSLFTVANLGDINGFQSLQKYVGSSVKLDESVKWYDQWNLFRQLIQAKPTQKTWQVKLVFLTREWYELIKKPGYEKLYAYLSEQVYKDTAPLREQFTFNFILSEGINNSGIQLEAYLAETLKYWYYMTCNASTGFAVAKDNTFAPISQLENILLNHYKVLKSAPIFMHRTTFKNAPKIHYYSLGYPNPIETRRPLFRKPKSHLEELDILSRAQTKIQKYLLDDYVKKAYNIRLYEQLERIQMQFFHHAPRNHPLIFPSDQLMSSDPSWEEKIKQFKGIPINWNHPFFRGIIQIKFKK